MNNETDAWITQLRYAFMAIPLPGYSNKGMIKVREWFVDYAVSRRQVDGVEGFPDPSVYLEQWYKTEREQ